MPCPPSSCSTHRQSVANPIGLVSIGEVCECVAGVIDAITVADAVRVDGVATADGADAAVVDLDRESGAVEVGRERKAEIRDQLKEAVVVIIGVDRRKIVGAGVIVEVAACGAGWCRHCCQLNLAQRDQRSLERLRPGDRRVEVGEDDIVPMRVQYGVALVGRVGRRAGAGDRIVGEDEPIHPGS